MDDQDRDRQPSITLVNRRVACANRVWSVGVDHIRASDGTEVVDYITLAPKVARPDLVAGVTVLPVVGDSFAFLRSYRHPVERFVWELPRGFIDPGEEPAAAALRELEEETGLTCAPDDLEFLGGVMPEASAIRARGLTFVARNCRPDGKRRNDEIGLGAVHFLSQRTVLDMLARFEIEEAMTCLTLYRHAFASGLLASPALASAPDQHAANEAP
jgi:ADP-ribose pyrophosphatase